MVRFKTRWLLLAIDDRPLATTSPFLSSFDSSFNASTSSSILSAAQQAPNTSTSSTLTPQLITRLLRASLATNFGDVAAGAFGGVLTCKYYSTHTGVAIVRCSRDAARLVWASATLISSSVEMSADRVAVNSEISGMSTGLRIRVIHCGGTIKKVQNKAIELDRKLIMRLRTKQKRLAAAANQSQGKKLESELSSIVSEGDEVSIAPVIPIAPVDHDEDLGEALDSSTPVKATPEVTTQQPSKTEHTNSASSHTTLDPVTQSLLAQSCKQISSITN
ncbi:related to POP5 - subunit of both RNase MRP and nuclear RNase P [Melanopsichium pennsylvanicum]|uniref:Related to POP5 - subunit of both RNase MRP and nuclear RNase P n=2 Tax=Melanopsichium pennsylvanicum TaxID=63383 RepID=A0AAJ4XK54_9BASI|nr:potential rn mrp complex component [Melanopsichium pennsylvanicum 4]SNX84234.1 related to POP5 - subunit of both RNase MRP and nuclear RNase P [Melanopsichium pennsylvanicum]